MSDQHPSQKLADEFAAGFRALADLLEVNPQLAEDMRYGAGDLFAMPEFNGAVTNQRERLAEWMRAAKSHGAKVTKDASTDNFKAVLTFGAVRVKVLANREAVCERVVTGTETVTKTVKDPALLAEVPEVEVTETVEIVEWQCKPLLAAEQVPA